MSILSHGFGSFKDLSDSPNSYTGEELKLLRVNSTGTGIEFTSSGGGGGSGDVQGPTSSTDNAIVRYDGTTGKLIQDSNVTIDDSGNIALGGNLDVNGNDIISSSGEVQINPSKHFRVTTTGSKIYKFDEAGNPLLEANPISPMEFVTVPIARYFRQTIVGYHSRKAQEQAQIEASNTTNKALDEIKLSVEVE